MIACPNCGRENEDHYKFCLGCGMELSKALARSTPAPPPEPQPVPEAKPVAAPVPTAVPQGTPRVIRIPTAPPTPAPVPEDAPAPPLAEDAEEADDTGEVPSDVAAELPFDMSEDGFMGAETLDASADVLPAMIGGGALPHATTQTPEPVEPAPAVRKPVSLTPAPTGPDARICHSCGAAVPEGFKFCGVCGTRYEATRAQEEPVYASGAVEGADSPATIVLVHPDGSEGERFPLSSGETTVGRQHEAPLFSGDPFLSPRHATFYFLRGQLFVRDESSLNGVFLRIRSEVELFHWDMFRIGQQLLRFEEMSQIRPVLPGAGDGTTVMGSPLRGAWGRLASVVAIDTTASIWCLRKPEEYLGRERGDIVFPEDGFVSGSHCKLCTRDGRYFLADLQSTNGTYLRIKGEGILSNGDLLLLGQQLFKIEMS